MFASRSGEIYLEWKGGAGSEKKEKKSRMPQTPPPPPPPPPHRLPLSTHLKIPRQNKQPWIPHFAPRPVAGRSSRHLPIEPSIFACDVTQPRPQLCLRWCCDFTLSGIQATGPGQVEADMERSDASRVRRLVFCSNSWIPTPLLIMKIQRHSSERD